ncbi:penicillin-binding protein [Viridibacillus sp. YIM B01967]|uniref:Penicillin-binding protein n=1 Tax=Viridibacillus soli TaxID=2798301 RepID=A0ABS1H618_9BACL|nr:penicillin-binding protein [Viridibacillus soli]MBK3494493.1 penicillin-binding protein [Viridibacillus soli]
MLIVYGGLFFAMFLRIFIIQASGQVEGQVLAAKAAAKYEKSKVITANRGNILDRQGQTIAKDTINYRLVAVISPDASEGTKNLMHVEDKEKTAKILAKYISMSEEDILKKLNTKEKNAQGNLLRQVEFGAAGRNINHGTMEKLSNEKLPGINFVENTKRFYPNGIFASNLIGLAQRETQEDGDSKTVGKMGLESIYNKELSGTNGSVNYKSDVWGYLLPNSNKMVKPAQNGNDVYLTIDKTIQNFLEDSMSKVYKKYNPDSMVAVVANPKTGEILAVSQRPTYNPQDGSGLENSWLNQLTELTIEPGSTMKTFTLATAVEEGKWHPNAFFQSGQYTVLDRTIRDSNQVGWGPISYLEGIQRSSNVGMAHLLKLVGDDTFVSYMKKFGFGEKTGIDLPNEATGQILDKWPINRVTTTYGQGSTVTPIQLIQALTAVANDGKMMQPYVIDKIVNPNTKKIVKENKPIIKGKPISAKTAKEVREILATTITGEKGTGQSFASKEYEVSGKTGTAQIPNASGGYYWGKNQFLYSFLGMAPVDDPQLVIYIAVEKPKLSVTQAGSEPTAAVFNTVMESSLKYLNIKPEKNKKIKSKTMDNYKGQLVEDVAEDFATKNVQMVIIGNGDKITAQYPAEKSKVLSGGTVFLKTDGESKIPDFTGWSLRDVLTYQTISGANIEMKGEGYVQKQSIKAGTTLNANKKIGLKLKKPEDYYK